MEDPVATGINMLRVYLKLLPDILPHPPAGESKYGFNHFFVDNDWLEEEGEEAAVNRELEVRLGSRAQGPLKLTERGPGIVGLADILEKYLKNNPSSIILKKWLTDAIIAAKLVYETAKVPVPIAGAKYSTENAAAAPPQDVIPAHSANISEPSVAVPFAGRQQERKTKAKVKRKKPDTKYLENFDDQEYPSAEESEDARAGGSKTHPLLLEITRPYQVTEKEREQRNYGSDVTKRFRCLGSRGCKTTWKKPRDRQRIFKHAKNCAYLPDHLRSEVRTFMAGKAVGPKARVLEEETDDEEDDEPPSKQAKVAPLTRIRSSSGSGASNLSIMKKFVNDGKKKRQDTADHALLLFVTCNGIPPMVVDSPEFKTFMSALNLDYHPPSANRLSDRLIPNEAANVHQATIEYLQTCQDLTISFDGGKLRSQTGLYTVTVTTADRRSFLMTLDDASRLSHTGDYISELLSSYICDIGPSRFSGTCSDNTGNTAKARRLVSAKWPQILNLQDACHELNLAINDICTLEYFKPVIGLVRGILAHMNKSMYTMECFNDMRKKMGINRGLVSVGETRFGTIYWSGESIMRGLPAFRAMMEDDQLAIEVPGLEETSAILQLQLDLTKLLDVIGPFAKSIKCLEATHATASDVLLFWLAIMAQLEQLFTKRSPHMLPNYVKEQIRAISNRRYDGMINNAPTDLYVATLFLDPRYHGAAIFKCGNLNPLSIPAITISQPGKQPVVKQKVEDGITRRVVLFLQKILRNEFGSAYEGDLSKKDAQKIMDERNPRLAHLNPAQALAAFKSEFRAFIDGDEPFNRPVRPKETVRQWWVAVQKNEHGHVLGALAIKLFSISVSSMADERIMSVITWLNNARRSRQIVSTVADHVKIRAWHRYKPELDAPKVQLSVKWRDMNDTVLGKRKNHPSANEATMTEVVQFDNNSSDVFADLDQPAPDLTDTNGTTFSAAALADIKSHALLDVLSDKPLASTATAITLSNKDEIFAGTSVNPDDSAWSEW